MTLASGLLVWGLLIGAFVVIVHVWEEAYHRVMRFCDEQAGKDDA